MVSGRAWRRAFLPHLLKARRKRRKTPQTLAPRVCDHCIQEEARDRSGHSLLGAMLMWGLSPTLLLCALALLSRPRCDIAFQVRPRAWFNLFVFAVTMTDES